MLPVALGRCEAVYSNEIIRFIVINTNTKEYAADGGVERVCLLWFVRFLYIYYTHPFIVSPYQVYVLIFRYEWLLPMRTPTRCWWCCTIWNQINSRAAAPVTSLTYFPTIMLSLNERSWLITRTISFDQGSCIDSLIESLATFISERSITFSWDMTLF